ncbi:MAG: hypothetical protein ACI9XZ_004019, partial [Alphaproteobacteria bacterium]
ENSSLPSATRCRVGRKSADRRIAVMHALGASISDFCIAHA